MSKAAIFIVEDEAIVAADLAGKLGQMGYRICGSTGSGEEALALVRRQRPDLVLMDIRLAGAMDGIEAAEILRRELDLPVIFLTAHSDRATLDRAKLTEPFGYLLKPFDDLGLETHIEMSLYKHQAEQRLLQAHEELELRVEERTRELAEAHRELRRSNETLEQRVADRTAELETANALLNESRQAALAVMQEAVEARRQVEEVNRDLLRESLERTRAEEKMHQAKQAAEAASRTKSQFLANMSHELRTPMTGVLGMLELALQFPSDAEQQDYLETAHRSARSLLRILNDILDLTKVEAGKFTLDDRPFDLRLCVSQTVDILVPEARRKGLRLTFSVADGLPERVAGDQVRLRQVLTNLIGNAVKFTDQGRVEVLVGEGHPAAAHSGIRFTVKDTGIGIPEDKKHLLFRTFSQVDDSNTRSYGGTGLGLAISREIVERMGGEIGFESAENRGSSFFFTIPVACAGRALEQVVGDGRRARPEEAACAGGGVGELRLLVAEDDATIRQVLGAMLKKSGFQVDFAEDGRKAVELWRQGSYDVLLMDVQMPRMDGFEATRTIREQEVVSGAHLPIIAMTAHAMKEDEQRCIGAGMDAYISKPIDFQECLGKVREMGRRQGRGR